MKFSRHKHNWSPWKQQNARRNFAGGGSIAFTSQVRHCQDATCGFIQTKDV